MTNKTLREELETCNSAWGMGWDFEDITMIEKFTASKIEEVIKEAGNISMEEHYSDRKERLIQLRSKYLGK